MLGDPGRLAAAARLFGGVEELNIDSQAAWSSGWPRLDNRKKNGREGFAGGTQLILYRKDLSALKRRLAGIPPEQYDAAYQSEHKRLDWQPGGRAREVQTGDQVIPSDIFRP